MEIANRPRRLRKNSAIRNMVRETRISKDSLILPLFVKEGKDICTEIPSLPGQYHYSPDRLPAVVEEALKAGVNSVLLFGLPEHKDEKGSSAYDENGVVQNGIREIKKRFPDVFITTDVCMCEYTSHGHCGILREECVDNDATLPYLAKIALSHVQAGCDMVAPSDMMDGRVAAIRKMLDANGYEDTPIMSYAVKYASAFYGPFRDAAGSAPAFGDRKSYQMDCHNSIEALREAELDVREGADILIVKPALSYLDIVKSVRESVHIPVAAYSVSGEYAMIKAAAKAGFIDEYSVMCESAVSAFRAGADMLISYYAKEIAGAIAKGVIG